MILNKKKCKIWLTLKQPQSHVLESNPKNIQFDVCLQGGEKDRLDYLNDYLMLFFYQLAALV